MARPTSPTSLLWAHRLKLEHNRINDRLATLEQTVSDCSSTAKDIEQRCTAVEQSHVPLASDLKEHKTTWRNFTSSVEQKLTAIENRLRDVEEKGAKRDEKFDQLFKCVHTLFRIDELRWKKAEAEKSIPQTIQAPTTATRREDITGPQRSLSQATTVEEDDEAEQQMIVEKNSRLAQRNDQASALQRHARVTPKEVIDFVVQQPPSPASNNPNSSQNNKTPKSKKAKKKQAAKTKEQQSGNPAPKAKAKKAKPQTLAKEQIPEVQILSQRRVTRSQTKAMASLYKDEN